MVVAFSDWCWQDAMDQYESTLHAQRALLEAIDRGEMVTEAAVAPFTPPELGGSMPRHLEHRALRLMQETAEVVALARRLSRAPRPVSALGRVPGGAAPTVLDRVL